MAKILKESNGIRLFERLSQWNALDDTIISKSNRMAKYADSSGSNEPKLWITCFKYSGKTYPINRYAKISPMISLTDYSVLARQDVEDSKYFIEFNPSRDKVRLYREVK